MDKKQLKREIATRLTKAKVNELVTLGGQNAFSIADLFEHCFDQDKTIAFHAAWVLEYTAEKFPEKFIPFLAEFIEALPMQHIDSCQRHFAKIVLQFTSPKAKKIHQAAFGELSANLHELLVETMFDWLIDPKTPVAVRVNCMEILCYRVSAYPWIREELTAQMLFYLKDGSAAIQSRGKRLLKQLEKVI